MHPAHCSALHRSGLVERTSQDEGPAHHHNPCRCICGRCSVPLVNPCVRRTSPTALCPWQPLACGMNDS